MYFCFKINSVIGALLILLLTIGTAVFLLTASVKAILTDKDVPTEEMGLFVPIIVYHNISDSNITDSSTVSPDVFKQDMQYLHDNGYTAVFVSDLIDYVENDKLLPDKPVIIAFDDSYKNIITYALPIIKLHDMKMEINIAGGRCQFSSDNNIQVTEDSSLTWADIVELLNSGYAEAGCHTYDMNNLNYRKGCERLSFESLEDYRSVLENDMGQMLNKINYYCACKPAVFAYPFGIIPDESKEILKRMGFKALLTCNELPNYITKDPECLLSLNRYIRRNDVTTEEFMERVIKS